MALGLTGGIIGLIAAVLALTVGGIGSALQGADTTATTANQVNFGMVTAGGWIALGASIVGIIGGALAMGRPVAGAILMLAAAIAGFIGVSLFYVISGPLLLVGAVLAFVGSRNPRVPAVAVAPVLAAPAAPQVSPDGRYWWDGRTWQPMPGAAPEPSAPRT
jgi:hypothetical protein